MSENENAICKIWDAAKAVLTGKVIAGNTTLKKKSSNQ